MADDDDTDTTTTTARGKRRKVLVLRIDDEPNLQLTIPAGRWGAELTNVPLRLPWRTTPPRRMRDWLQASQLDPRPRNLKRWLQANCLTQAIFAKRAGCSQGMISQLEKGKRAARPKLAVRIERLTGLPHDLFLDLGKPPRKKRGPPGRSKLPS